MRLQLVTEYVDKVITMQNIHFTEVFFWTGRTKCRCNKRSMQVATFVDKVITMQKGHFTRKNKPFRTDLVHTRFRTSIPCRVSVLLALGEAFFCFSQICQPHTRDQRPKNKTLVLSLRAGYARVRDKKTYWAREERETVTDYRVRELAAARSLCKYCRYTLILHAYVC